MMSAGSAAFGPRIVPMRKYVNGNKSKINMMNGIARNTLTSHATMIVVLRLPEGPRLSVKNNNNPSHMADAAPAATEINVIYNVSYVASINFSTSKVVQASV